MFQWINWVKMPRWRYTITNDGDIWYAVDKSIRRLNAHREYLWLGICSSPLKPLEMRYYWREVVTKCRFFVCTVRVNRWKSNNWVKVAIWFHTSSDCASQCCWCILIEFIEFILCFDVQTKQWLEVNGKLWQFPIPKFSLRKWGNGSG